MAISTLHFRLAAATLALLASPARGGELYYAARWDQAGWKVSSSRQECRMAQEIPAYGTAVFSRKAGQDLTFSLDVQQYATRETTARLASVPPVWIHTGASQELGEVAFARGERPLLLKGDQARRLLAELEKGMWPTLTYRDWGDQRDQVVVAVSAINLHASLPPFLGCLEGLLPAEFSEMRNSAVNFGLATATLEPADRWRLQQLAKYVRADETVKGITITGHIYSRPPAPPGLGEKRTEAVRAFLVAQGIAAGRIKVDHQRVAAPKSGDGYPLFRRVQVTLVR
jgi:outer membrane protein OmpA-like peptidoglycan-associated protein